MKVVRDAGDPESRDYVVLTDVTLSILDVDEGSSYAAWRVLGGLALSEVSKRVRECVCSRLGREELVGEAVANIAVTLYTVMLQRMASLLAGKLLRDWMEYYKRLGVAEDMLLALLPPAQLDLKGVVKAHLETLLLPPQHYERLVEFVAGYIRGRDGMVKELVEEAKKVTSEAFGEGVVVFAKGRIGDNLLAG